MSSHGLHLCVYVFVKIQVCRCTCMCFSKPFSVFVHQCVLDANMTPHKSIFALDVAIDINVDALRIFAVSAIAVELAPT